MKLIVLLSCMYQNDTSIILKSNIQTDIVVVNQSNNDSIEEFDFINKKGDKCHARFINTRERGLSKSRNMAIKNAWGDICLICDDDEILSDDYEEIILNAYKENPQNASITFIVERKDRNIPKKYPPQMCRVGLLQIMKTSSVQITFRLNQIIQDNISFDTMLGSGSGNGSGEENKFLLDIRRKGHNIIFFPGLIGLVLPGDSLWFSGFTTEYMRNQGWSSRRSLGAFWGLLYILLFWIRHLKLYKKDITPINAIRFMIAGFFERR